MHHIPDDVFLIAARELAASVRDEDLEQGSLYPPLGAIREISLRIAAGITKYAYCKGKIILFNFIYILIYNFTLATLLPKKNVFMKFGNRDLKTKISNNWHYRQHFVYR